MLIGDGINMKSIQIIKTEHKLLVRYKPRYNFNEIVKQIKAEGIYVKRTFWVNENNLEEINVDEEYILFKIANEETDYFYSLNLSLVKHILPLMR